MQAPTTPLLSLHPAADGASLIAIVACVAIAAGLMVSLLAIKLYFRMVDATRQARFELEAVRHQIAFRDALLASNGEAVAVLGGMAGQTESAERASALLATAMDGPDSRRLAAALSALIDGGTPFQFVARTKAQDEAVALRGTTVWNRAVAFVRGCAAPVPALDYFSTLENMPVPIWVRGPDLALRWGNRAFLDATSAASLQNALASNASLQRSEMDLAASALECGSIEAVRYALVDGERRAFALKFVRLADSTVAGVAIDMTEKAQAEGNLRLHLDATSDMLEGLSFGIAIFDKEKRLSSWNAAYAKTWAFTEDWLETHPSRADVLDRLRDTRQLPEQHNHALWKAGQLALFEDGARQREEFWHLAEGRSLRVVTRPHLLGGVVVMVEDVSAALRLESSFNMLIQVQRATLDTMEDGVAIFAPDGRLVLSNGSFAGLWNLSEEDLAGQPHFTKVANLAEARKGRDGIWSIVGTGILSAEPERCNEWGKARRADGRVISLSMSRLPNGATIATFRDLTEMERFQRQTEMCDVAA